MITAKKISKCRLCESTDLTSFFSTGNIYINDFPTTPTGHRGKAEMTLVRCNECTLIQLDQTVDSEVYFEYWYQSKLNKKIVNNLQDIVNEVKKEVSLEEGDYVLDIGANDGTLLSFYEDLPITRIGCDPAKSIQDDLKKHSEYQINDLFHKSAWDKITKQKAKVITAIAMFYDLDNPHEFVRGIQQILAPDGVFVVQLMPARPMLDTYDIGNVCHEHLLYYTYESLVTLFEEHGLQIYKLKENDINGGSYQLWVKHSDPYGKSIHYEEDCSLDRLHEWTNQINKNRIETVRFINKEVQKGKNIYFYGASTKGNTIAQWYGLNPTNIKGAAEIHPDKVGRYMVGSQIPIVHEDEARKDADYFVIIGFGFRDIFIEKEKKFLKNGGKLIFCTPKFEIVEHG
jgi:hypothetical protein